MKKYALVLIVLFAFAVNQAYSEPLSKSLSISLETHLREFIPNQNQNIDGYVVFASYRAPGVIIDMTAEDPSGSVFIKNSETETDSSGKYSFSFFIPEKAELGRYTVYMNATKPGYASTEMQFYFWVVDKATDVTKLPWETKKVLRDGQEFDVSYRLTSGKVEDMESSDGSFFVYLKNRSEGFIELAIPKNLIEPDLASIHDEFSVRVNGYVQHYEETDSTCFRMFKIKLLKNSSVVKIITHPFLIGLKFQSNVPEECDNTISTDKTTQNRYNVISVGDIYDTTEIKSPRHQLSSGAAPEDIICNEGLQLILKSSNDSPACVKPATKQKLIERGLSFFVPISVNAELCSWDDIDLKEMEQSWIGEKTEEGYDKNGGFYRHYENTQFPDLKASIYCSDSETGAHLISGEISDFWFNKGGINGILGYTTTDVLSLSEPYQDGQIVEFQGGVVIFKKGVGTRMIPSGPILDKWKSLGAEQSVLGLPNSDYNNTPTDDGFYQLFQNGIILWKEGEPSAYALNGKYYDDWSAKSYVFRDSGLIGFPKSDGLDPNAKIKEDKGHFPINYSGESLTAYFSKSPIIDGNIESEEWKEADLQKFREIREGGHIFRGTIYVMRDDENLYIGLRLNENVLEGKIVEIFFDNEHNGQRDIGDDIISYGSTWLDRSISEMTSNSFSYATDEVINGKAAALDRGVYNHYEFSHPLCSGDSLQDFCLKTGDTVGFQITYTKNKRQITWPNWGEIIIADSPENKLSDLIRLVNLSPSLLQTPLTQIKSGAAIEDVECNYGHALLLVPSKNTSVCVKPQTAEKLIERGWGILPEPSFSVSLSEVFPGATIIVDGQGFHPNSDLSIILNDEFLAMTKTDSVGQFNKIVVFPVNASIGEYNLQVKDEMGNNQSMTILVTSEKNNRIKKFDSQFYEKVIDMIESGENRYYSTIIIVPDEGKQLLQKLLEDVHNAKNVSKGEVLSFVTANIPIQEIPELADYEFITRIGDGEKKVTLEGS